MLRDKGPWCRLEVEGAFTVHVGWDQYLYLGSSWPCETALTRTGALGLFPQGLLVVLVEPGDIRVAQGPQAAAGRGGGGDIVAAEHLGRYLFNIKVSAPGQGLRPFRDPDAAEDDESD
ncbi:hypothetical protein ACODT5_16030 [Streptomyces sp. 5.8]|uniref:hypothetical protein n=1 Tax=Streptomyces sp. 5.8 TaxID=3406571 RepID=UPI003BB5F101